VVFNPHPLDRCEAISYLLISPLIARGNSKSEEIDNTLGVQLSCHSTYLTIIANGIEVSTATACAAQKTGRAMAMRLTS
jgi:hypothetical protein